MEKKDLLSTLFRVIIREGGEDVVFGGLNKFLVLLFASSFQLAFGSFALALPIAALTTFGLKAGYITALEMSRVKALGTAYRVSVSPKSKILVAQNIQPASLADFPVPLPIEASFYPNDLIRKTLESNPQASILDKLAVRQLDVRPIYKSVSELLYNESGSRCVECGKAIYLLEGYQVGHISSCSRNPNRYFDWCDDCFTDLTISKHKVTCIRYSS
ncbi:MAG: hypothetical protein IPM31_19455 [Anaerolineae bacterium]|nr:hypothetical protein [Anaerolineae bacterium]MBL8105235.1 hypothetical protein [Anaerolineales bacterium]MCC7187660.1 hypothetical protein [Anaerolineales bacterium]